MLITKDHISNDKIFADTGVIPFPLTMASVSKDKEKHPPPEEDDEEEGLC